MDRGLRVRTRRAFIGIAAVGLLATARRSFAQTPNAPKRVALLAFSNPQLGGPVVDDLKKSLADLGWIEGSNVVYEARWADGRAERLPELARELVAWQPDVIWTYYTLTAKAAQEATKTIPIFFANSADPVGAGLARSLAQPGGNATGMLILNAETGPKVLELLRVAVPRLARVAVLWDPAQPITSGAIATRVSNAAQAMGLKVLQLPTQSLPEMEQAFARMERERADALVVVSSAPIAMRSREIAELIRKYRLPTASFGSLDPKDGVLLSYGQSGAEWRQRQATYVDRILKGERPAEMPIEGAMRFELKINLRVARTLGIAVPQSLLLRADEVIE